MTHIAIAGDWHANRNWAGGRIMSAGSKGIKLICHVGDFGLYPDETTYLDMIQKLCTRHQMVTLVTDGNHEHHDWINRHPVEKTQYGFVRKIRPRIWVQTRGNVFHINNYYIGSLGGAASLDFEDLVENIEWFPTETPTLEQAQMLINKNPAQGLDLLLTHETSDYTGSKIHNIINTNPLGWPKSSVQYAKESRNIITNTVKTIQPALHVHGHMHVFDEHITRWKGNKTTSTLSLPANGNQNNMIIVDTETKKWKHWKK